MAAPRVSVIIPAYHSGDTVAECLEALRAQTFRSFETVLINSSPDTRTPEIVQSRFPEVVFEQRPSRLRAQAARNRGVELARGELLVFTDPDCRAHPAWLERLVGAYDAGHPVASGAMGLVSDTWFQWAVHVSKFSWLLPGSPAGPCHVVCTANAAYARRVFDRIGPFESDICIGDAVLSWRAGRAGAAPWLEPGAIVEHWHEHTFTQYVREFVHRGREFAIAKSAFDEWSPVRTVAHMILFPVVAALEVARTGRSAIAAGRFRRWIAAVPLVVVFKLAWTYGEAGACLDLLLHAGRSPVERLKALHS